MPSLVKHDVPESSDPPTTKAEKKAEAKRQKAAKKAKVTVDQHSSLDQIPAPAHAEADDSQAAEIPAVDLTGSVDTPRSSRWRAALTASRKPPKSQPSAPAPADESPRSVEESPRSVRACRRNTPSQNDP
jgi:hypothetical protein